MLDNLKLIHERDAQDALGIAEKQPVQLDHVFDFQSSPSEPIENVVYAGMGGSALAAQLSQTWPGYSVPFEICRQYDIPAYVGKNTLFVAASYSGNTEETISTLQQAEEKGANIVVITGGGKLEEIARKKSYPLLKMPKAEQPRFAVLYNLKALLTILVGFSLVDEVEVGQVLTETKDFLEKSIQEWIPTRPTSNNPAKQLAKELMGKSPVVYAGPLLFPAAYKWKISFNENAKNVAWCSQYPEFNHNEFMGWASHPVDKPYGVIDLRSNLEHERINKRFVITERLLSGKRPQAHVINAEGTTKSQQLLWTVAFGDFVSIYLALLNGVNPTPVELVEKLKKELG